MPSDTMQVMEAAQKVAQLLAQHPAVGKYKLAQRAVADDPDASRLLADFDRQIHRLAQQQQSGLPITAAQQSQLEALQTKIISHIKIKALNMAQVEYVDLRRKIGALLDSAVQDKPAAASGSSAAAAPSAPAGGPKITMPR